MKIKDLFKKSTSLPQKALPQTVKTDENMEQIISDIRLAVDDLKSYLLSRGITIPEYPKDTDWNTLLKDIRTECEEIRESLNRQIERLENRAKEKKID